MATLLFMLNFLVLFVYGVHGDICTTPNGKTGQCLNVTQCDELLSLVKKSDRTSEELTLLQKSFCGQDGDMIKVCCPAQKCRTPENIEGDCVSILSCPHMSERIKQPISDENRVYVQKSICQGALPYSVCCGPATNTESRVASVTTSPEAVKKNQLCSDKITPQDPSTGCCGRESTIASRIINGNATAIDQFPWMAAIEYIRSNKNANPLQCGAALISAKYVLTAAHCISDRAIRTVGIPKLVRLGEYDTNNDGPDCVDVEGGGTDCTDGAVKINIERYTPHPEYNALRGINDIGLLRLEKNAPYTDFIRPICLPTSDITTSSAIAFYISGWGRTDEHTAFSNIKQYAEVSFVERQVCRVPYRNVGIALPETVICAGSQSGQDTCKGDSGGPLMYEKDNVYEVTGVVNFGPKPCGQRNFPGVYAKVYAYRDWILSNTVE